MHIYCLYGLVHTSDGTVVRLIDKSFIHQQIVAQTEGDRVDRE